MIILFSTAVAVILAGTVILSFSELLGNIRELYMLRRLFAQTKYTSSYANPSNEGKLVMISGELEVLKPVVDKETGRAFEEPVVRRIDEVYFGAEGKRNKSHGWNVSSDKYLIGRARMGDFEIDQEILRNIPCEKHIEMLNGKHRHIIECTSYQTYTGSSMTLMGIQKGGKLMADRRFGGNDVVLGLRNVDSIMKKRCRPYMKKIGFSLLLILELIVLLQCLLYVT